MYKALVLGSLLFAAVCAPAFADVPLSLDRAIDIALQNNQHYGIALAEVQSSAAQLREARAPLAPALSLGDQYQYANNIAKLQTPLGPIPFSSVNATNVPIAQLQYTLFDGGLTAARVSQAAAGLSAAEASAREARAAVIDQASKAYYDVLEARQMDAVAARAVDVAHAHVVQTQQMLAAGMIPRADVLRAQAEEASRIVDRIAADDGIKLAQLALDNVLGVPLSTAYDPTGTLSGSVPAFDLGHLLASAHAARGELAAARFAVDAAQAAVNAARSSEFPTVRAVASDGNTQPAVVAGYHNQISVGLSAVWMLFDNGYTAGRVTQARAGLREAQLGLQALESGIDLQVEQAYLKVREAQAETEAASRAVDLTSENLRLSLVRYQGGVGTPLELADAQLRDRDARVQLTQAQAALRQSIVQLQFEAGLL